MNYFTHDVGKQDKNRTGFRWARRALINGCRNDHFGTTYEPAVAGIYWIAKHFRVIRAVLDGEARYLSAPVGGAHLLDVGCGNGDFVDLASRMGWFAQGVDFDDEAVQVAQRRGLVAHAGDIESLLPDLAGFFDVITLSHVLEHVYDPIALLRRCHQLLTREGFLYIETPNLNSTGHKAFGAAWRGLEPPRHLVLFTSTSINQALRVAGFETAIEQPWRPLCWHTYIASESIRAAIHGSSTSTVRAFWQSLHAERAAMRSPAIREYIVVKAFKP